MVSGRNAPLTIFGQCGLSIAPPARWTYPWMCTNDNGDSVDLAEQWLRTSAGVGVKERSQWPVGVCVRAVAVAPGGQLRLAVCRHAKREYNTYSARHASPKVL